MFLNLCNFWVIYWKNTGILLIFFYFLHLHLIKLLPIETKHNIFVIFLKNLEFFCANKNMFRQIYFSRDLIFQWEHWKLQNYKFVNGWSNFEIDWLEYIVCNLARSLEILFRVPRHTFNCSLIYTNLLFNSSQVNFLANSYANWIK